MAMLRACAEEAGGRDVTTYIQSGNVVCNAPLAADELAARLEGAVEAATGHDVAVVLRTLAELEQVVEANPFAREAGDPTKVHVIFLDRPAAGAVPDDLDLASFAPEELAPGERELYLHLPDGMGRAKLPLALMKRTTRTRQPATARNWRTVTKLVELARAAVPA